MEGNLIIIDSGWWLYGGSLNYILIHVFEIFPSKGVKRTEGSF